MTRIEFYVLPGEQPAARLQTACQLALKAWRQGLPVFLRCSDAQQCRELDELLWQFRRDTFVPHNLHADDPLAPVVIGENEAPAQANGVLLNLGHDLSGHLAQFQRIIEIVDQQPELLAAGRENFRSYRQRGYDPRRVEL
ncbi:DNA polymerase III subunit chi [Pseudomonas sp. N040]|uniref:DNA polymerase III subunit chi n=1 Tax=Pseudomonas sp. N040 TaxID=2785325 RepID=UPI0018A29E1D|nr:DNA polymerase III subunit chi [Pseudomonas sp. N040]MBF7731098.1 DNA polymerase III subunit chi [Pseudomonas sp. N040]MBW7014741.1 DNA polymerase III subunit chi [Pseudomonas sp. N040]